MSIFIGDIHGTYKTLKKLLEKYPSDPIYLVGDLIDRGPGSVDVIQFLIDNYDRIKCVIGNHEEMMMDFYSRPQKPRMNHIWLMNGGKKVFEKYHYSCPEKLRSHLKFIKSLPYYIELPDLKNNDERYPIISHSIIKSKNIQKCIDDQSIIWGRYFPENDISEGKWFNIFGHTPVLNPWITDHWANIDTGCCFKGHLTAMEWPSLNCTMIKNCE